MADDIAVDIDLLRDYATRMQSLGEDVAAQQGGWMASLQGSPSVWGSDEEGVAFANAYQQVLEAAGELFAELADGLDAVGSNLRTMADNLEAIDESNQDRLLAIVHRLGGFL